MIGKVSKKTKKIDEIFHLDLMFSIKRLEK